MVTRTARRLTPVQGRAMRATKTDACGRIVVGEYNHAVSEGLVTVAFTANTISSDAITVTKFNGVPCVNVPEKPSLAGYGVDFTFCNVDYELFEIITGQTLVFDANGVVVGLEMDTEIELTGDGFALEVWTGTYGGDACDDETAEGEYGYLLLPYLKGGIVGDFTVENNAVSFVITGAQTVKGNRWGSGPYAVEMDELGDPGPLFQPISSTAPFRLQTVTVNPPTETTGARPVLDTTLPAFTNLVGIEGATPLETAFTTTPASTGPVWYDFGDGEWDYVAIPGTASHIYETAGTYTVQASQNGVTWFSEEVVVPWP